jgi:hypothetical protein
MSRTWIIPIIGKKVSIHGNRPRLFHRGFRLAAGTARDRVCAADRGYFDSQLRHYLVGWRGWISGSHAQTIGLQRSCEGWGSLSLMIPIFVVGLGDSLALACVAPTARPSYDRARGGATA